MHDLDPYFIDGLGYLAAGAVFLTFCMRTMIALRVAAITSNIAFISYAAVAQLTPILLLHGALLALNVTQFVRVRRQVARSEIAVRDASGGDFANSFDWLLPLTRRRRFGSRSGEMAPSPLSFENPARILRRLFIPYTNTRKNTGSAHIKNSISILANFTAPSSIWY